MNGLVKQVNFDEHLILPSIPVLPNSMPMITGRFIKPAAFNIDILRGKASATLENKFDKLQGAFKVYRKFWWTHFLTDFIQPDRNSGAMLYQTYKFVRYIGYTGGVDF